jgi:Kdo2-lipid IVA lauroyltransferase/acyltransferase
MNIGEWLVDAWEASLHWMLQHIPVETASAIGSFIVRMNVKINRPEIIAGARRNLAIHRPGISEAEIEASVWRFLDNVGRLMSEFSVLLRLQSEGRIELLGAKPVQAINGTEPIVGIILHTGNWEVFGPALQSAGIEVATFYEPPARAFQRRIAEDTRRNFGFRLLEPNSQGVREAISLLKRNRIVAIFGDEARGGHTMAPLFGRPPHGRGNLALAARLARHTQALIVVGHSERLEGCRFRMHISEPFALPDGDPGLLADVAFLNARIERVILANLDRWYFLDDSIAPLDDHQA